MKKNWETKKLSDVCQVIGGGTPSKKVEEFYTGDIPWATVRDMKSELLSQTEFRITEKAVRSSSTNVIPGNNVVIATRVGLGKICLLKKDTAINQDLRGIIPNDPKILSVRFLFAWFKSVAHKIEAEGTGATVKGVKLPFINSLQIPLPPLPEQHRIVAILDKAFQAIDTAKANAEKNLKNARELFESYLDFVFKNQKEEFVERSLGDKDLVDIIDGDRGANYPKKSDFHQHGYCLFMSTKNVRPDGFKFEDRMFITEEKDRKLRNGKLKRNDLVMTTRGTIGNIGLYSDDIEFENIRINSGMLIFRVNPNVILSSFLFELFRSNIIKTQTKKLTSGAAQPQLPIKTLVNFKIPVPISLDVQQSLVDNIRNLYKKTQKLEKIYQQKLTALDELKKSILHKAFSGEL